MGFALFRRRANGSPRVQPIRGIVAASGHHKYDRGESLE